MHAALLEFLCASFSVDELRRWVRDGMPNGRRLVQDLPEHGTPREVCDALVELLVKRGLVDAPLFDALLAALPGTRPGLAALAGACAVAWHPPDPAADHRTGVDATRERGGGGSSPDAGGSPRDIDSSCGAGGASRVRLLVRVALAVSASLGAVSSSRVRLGLRVALTVAVSLGAALIVRTLLVPAPTLELALAADMPAARVVPSTIATVDLRPRPPTPAKPDAPATTPGPAPRPRPRPGVARPDVTPSGVPSTPITPAAACAGLEPLVADLSQLAAATLTPARTERFTVELSAAGTTVSPKPGPGQRLKQTLYDRLQKLGAAELGACRGVPLAVVFTRSRTTVKPK